MELFILFLLHCHLFSLVQVHLLLRRNPKKSCRQSRFKFLLQKTGLSIAWPSSSSPQGVFRNMFKLNIGGVIIPIGFVLVLVAVIVMSTFLNKTRPGRYIIAIGSNKEALRLSGVNVVKWQWLAYIISGLFTGFAAIAYAGVLASSVAPGAGAGLEMDAICSAIIGGTSMNGGSGTVVGTILGVFVMALLKVGLPFVGFQANMQRPL